MAGETGESPPVQKESIFRRAINKLTGKGPTNTEVRAVDSAGKPLQPDFAESPFTQQTKETTVAGMSQLRQDVHSTPLGKVDPADQGRARVAQLQMREMRKEAPQKIAQQELEAERKRQNINEAILESQRASGTQNALQEAPTDTSTEATQPTTPVVPMETPTSPPPSAETSTPTTAEVPPTPPAQPEQPVDTSWASKVLETPKEELEKESPEFPTETTQPPPTETSPPGASQNPPEQDIPAEIPQKTKVPTPPGVAEPPTTPAPEGTEE